MTPRPLNITKEVNYIYRRDELAENLEIISDNLSYA